jgi:hypothetical protein
MSLTYEQFMSLRNKSDAHVNCYKSRINYLVRTIVLEDDQELKDMLYRSLVRMLGDSLEADTWISDYTESLNNW